MTEKRPHNRRPSFYRGLPEEIMKRQAASSKKRSTGPTSGLIITKFPKDLRRRIKIQALLQEMTMTDWMISRLQEAVDAVERRR